LERGHREISGSASDPYTRVNHRSICTPHRRHTAIYNKLSTIQKYPISLRDPFGRVRPQKSSLDTPPTPRTAATPHLNKTSAGAGGQKMMKLFGLGSEPAKPAPQTQRPPGPASSSGKPPPASQAQHNPAPATQPQPKREEPRAGGGFFNLPVAGAAAAAPSVPVSAPSNDLFGALSTHTASTSSPAAAPAPFRCVAA
jgi:hypothetical protein